MARKKEYPKSNDYAKRVSFQQTYEKIYGKAPKSLNVTPSGNLCRQAKRRITAEAPKPPANDIDVYEGMRHATTLEDINSFRMMDAALGIDRKSMIRKTFEDEVKEHDWDFAAFEKYNYCPECNGIPADVIPADRRRKALDGKPKYTLMMTRKTNKEQQFVCKNCRQKFVLLKDQPMEGRRGLVWRAELEKLEKPAQARL